MTYNRKTLDMARGLLDDHGVVAGCQYAAERIDQMKLIGDGDGVARWKRLMAAMMDLSDVMRPDDTVH